MKRNFIIGLGVVLSLSGAVRADQMTLTHTFILPNIAQPELIAVPKFDVAGQSLVMVVVRLSATLDAFLCGENRAAVPATMMGSIKDGVSLAPTPPLPGIMPVESVAMAMQPDTQPVLAYNPAGSYCVQAPPPPPGDMLDEARWSIPAGTVVTNETVITTPQDLLYFMGAGTVNFTATPISELMFSSSNGNASATAYAKADANITVIYRFVPEPASLGLLLVGGLLVVRRRSRRSA